MSRTRQHFPVDRELTAAMAAMDGGRRGVKRRVSAQGGGLTKRQRKAVTTLINRRTELKYFYFSTTTAAIPATAAISGGQFDIAQGITDSERVGDSIEWAGSIDLKVQVVNGIGATGDEYNNIRMLIVQWHPNSIPTPASVLLAGPSAVVDIYSMPSHDNRQEFKILFDKTWRTVGNTNAATTPGTSALTTGVLSYQIPLTKATKKVQYVGGALTGTNRFYVITMSDSILATHPSLTYTTKVVYRDA